MALDDLFVLPASSSDADAVPVRVYKDASDKRWEVAAGAYVDGAGVGTLVTPTSPYPVGVIGSVAVTGSFWQATQPVSLASLPSLAAGTAAIGKLAANSGVVIGDVNVAAFPALSASTDSVAATDGGGTLTVDAPVGAPVFVRLSDGSSAISTLPVSLASVPSHAVTNAGTFAVQATGDVASLTTDSGNPVKVAAVYNSTFPGPSTGQRIDLQAGSRGALRVQLAAPNANADFTAASGLGDGGVGTMLAVGDYVWNGAGTGTWDRKRGNSDLTVFTSAARTATPTPFDGTNYNGRGLHLVIDVTSVTASPSVTFTVQGKDVISGKFYTLLASAAITGTGTTILRVYPGLTAAGNLVATDVLPRIFRVIATHGNSDSITYSVGASVIL